MSTAQFTCPLIVVIPGQLIAASLWNGEFQNLFTNINPLGVGAYSDTDPQMQTATDPFPSGATSRPTSLGGEIERLRFVLAEITGNTYWYQVPTNTLATLATSITAILARFPIQTADIGLLQVTAATIANNTITATQIANNTITATQIANATITATQLATSVAGNGLSGGAGTPLAVNVDNSTLDISADTVEVKAGGITSTQLSSTLLTLVTPKQPKTNVSSLVTANSVNGSFGTVLSVSGAGALKGITLKADRGGGASGQATFTIRITLDGVQYTVAGLIANFTNIFQIAASAWANAKPPTLASYFTSNAVAGTGSDFYFGFKTSLLIELEATAITDGNNGFYVATSYEN